MPTIWDEIRYIIGEPGKHSAIARMKDQQWFVAVVNVEKSEKNVRLELPMLAGQEFNL